MPSYESVTPAYVKKKRKKKEKKKAHFIRAGRS